MSRSKEERDSSDAPRTPKQRRRWLWSLFVYFFIWYLTGLPFSFINPQWVEVKAVAAQTTYGNSPSSWHEDIVPEVTNDLIQWGRDNGLHPDTLVGAIKAASLERDLQTGKPMEGTGYRVDMFDILGITSIETVLGQNEVDPTAPNPTGGCIAWWELVSHRLLDGVRETSDLKKIVEPLGLKAMEVYGSCGGGAIGWTQALPSNWWSLMGPGFDPWTLEDSAEFTARYFTVHGYFSSGRRAAVHSYNPGAGDSYTDPVIAKADSLRASFEVSGLGDPKVTLITTIEQEETESIKERLDLDVQVERPTKDVEINLNVWPVDGPRGSWAFGVKTWYQASHTGEDTMCPIGTEVRSPGPGIVESTAWWPQGWESTGLGHGNTVWIFHGYTAQGEPVRSLVAHMSGFEVGPGEWVTAGQLIGYSGDTGAGSGPHAHIAVRIGGDICYLCGDWSQGHWEDPDDWINSGKVIYAELPNNFDLSGQTSSNVSDSSFSNGGRIRTDIETTLTLRRTPVLRTALWLGGKGQSIDEVISHLQKIAELLDKAGSVAEFILEAEEEIETFDRFLESVGIDISAREFFESIQQADKLLDRVQGIADFLIKTQKSMLNLHQSLSIWSIGGQPRELGLDPLLDWRLYPIDNTPEGGGAQ